MSNELPVHATGLCAMALNVLALVRRCERSLRVQSGIAGFVWALNDLLLGAHTAAALSLVSAGRTATSAVTLRSTDALRRAAFVGFAMLTLAVGALTLGRLPLGRPDRRVGAVDLRRVLPARAAPARRDADGLGAVDVQRLAPPRTPRAP
jgi:hypothetical protein